MAEPGDRQIPRELTGRIGKYQILRPLGRGAMGHVYVAHDTVLDRDVALKVMAAQIADDAELKQRFEREARAIAKMTHPNVVTVFDLGSHSDGSPYIAMELLRGLDLQKTMRQTPLPLERKVAIILQVLAGLGHAHQAGIVHRDIKPANIFLREDGSVKIMDFGVARLTTASLTGTGNVVGTADYMSPEQVQGARVDGRSDLFSVGCLLFELIAGRRPFHAESLVAIFYKITHEDADFSLIPADPEPQSLLPILRKALSRRAEERYQTAREFATDLRAWLQAHAPAAAAAAALAEAGAGPTIVDGPGSATPTSVTVDLGQPRTGPVARRTVMATRAPGPAALGPSASRPGIRRAPVSARRARRRRSGLGIGMGMVALLAVAAGGTYLWMQRASLARGTAAPRAGASAAPSSSTAASVPPTPAPIPPPVTAAPPPTFARDEGRAAASLRAGREAFEAGRYDRAVSAAQQALRDDPDSATARQLLAQASTGRRALTRVASGGAALARGDLAEADRQAALALAEAPWDRAAVELRSRIEAARQESRREGEAKAQREKAQQERAARLNELLSRGASAMEAKRFDAAVAAYNQVLELDPGNVAALTGKSNAITARTVAEAAAAGRAPAAPIHGFVAGRTEAKGHEATGLIGFEESGIPVQRATQAAELPGKIRFETIPAAPQPGEKFSVSAFLVNEGSQPIALANMLVATTVDGRTQKGRVPLVSKTVAPRDRALVFQARDQLLREGTRSWTMEVTLFTSAGETYASTLAWR